MGKITVGDGASDMAADQDEARRALAASGNRAPTQDEIDAEVQKIVDRRDGSAHLEQRPDGVPVVAPDVERVGRDQGAPRTPATDPAADPDDDGDAYDPGEHTVDEVKAHLDQLGDGDDADRERERIIDAERNGRGRVGITG